MFLFLDDNFRCLAAAFAMRSTSSIAVDFMGVVVVQGVIGNVIGGPDVIVVVVAAGEEVGVLAVIPTSRSTTPSSVGECGAWFCCPGAGAGAGAVVGLPLPSYALMARYHSSCCSLVIQHISHFRLACTMGSYMLIVNSSELGRPRFCFECISAIVSTLDKSKLARGLLR